MATNMLQQEREITGDWLSEVVFLGDSLLRRLAHEYLSQRPGIDLTISGYTAHSLLVLCKLWREYLVGRKIVICIGYNDYIKRAKTLHNVCWDLYFICEWLERTCTSVIFLTIPPYPYLGQDGLRSLAQVNKYITEMARGFYDNGSRKMWVLDAGKLFISRDDRVRYHLYEQAGDRRHISADVKHWNAGEMEVLCNALRRFLFSMPPTFPTPSAYWIGLKARLTPVAAVAEVPSPAPGMLLVRSPSDRNPPGAGWNPVVHLPPPARPPTPSEDSEFPTAAIWHTVVLLHVKEAYELILEDAWGNDDPWVISPKFLCATVPTEEEMEKSTGEEAEESAEEEVDEGAKGGFDSSTVACPLPLSLFLKR